MLRRAVATFLVAPLVLMVTGTALAGGAGHSALASNPATRAPNSFDVTNLVSDQPGHAQHLDPNLVNAWGLAASSTSPWWVADNGTNLSTLYTGDGSVVPLVVGVARAPTGAVFNGTSDFVVSHGSASGPSAFLFATERGTILGWNPAVPPPPPSTKAFVVVDRSPEGAIYKGLAIASTNHGERLYATDFHNRRVDVFNGHFDLIQSSHAFIDPSIPRGYAPFGIQALGDEILVTYAKQDADAEDDVPGAGHGFVDAFNTNGWFLRRVASRGALNSPWGLVMAPEVFGSFGGDLLIGNFGNGRINAFGPSHGHVVFLDQLRRSNGRPIRIDGLWALGFGNGEGSGPTDHLFFTAGPDEESHGLFGSIAATGDSP